MDVVFERRGKGPPLVLLHGIGHRWQAWEPVFDLLAADRDVIALDLPGFGASPVLPADTKYDMDAAMRFLAEFFDELKLGRPHIAGNSLGGLFALEAADRCLVSSATALSPAGFFTPLELWYATTTLRASWLAAGAPAPLIRLLARDLRRRKLLFGHIYGRPEQLDVETLIADAKALRAAPAFIPMLRAGRNLTTFAGTCDKVPVTIAWGTHDRLLGRAQAVRAQQRLPGARFVWLPDCGHVPMGDNPELVAELLLEGSSSPLIEQDRPGGQVARTSA
ncbi:MAG TPA: alpha/beta hydrolase [Streptosporangiaceae bacterium]